MSRSVGHELPASGARPLTGRRVLVLRSQAQADALSERIVRLGGEAVAAPVLTVEPGDLDALRAAVEEVAAGAYELVCLTSPNGVDALADALLGAGRDARALAAAGSIACVGPGTAARLWERLRITADLLPPRSTTRALGEAVPPGRGRALLARADIASPELPELLRAKGYHPTEVVAYRTGRPDALDPSVLDAAQAGMIDLVAVASPSTVRNLLALLEGRPVPGRVVSIGPVTSAACAGLGVEVAVEAVTHDLDGLVAALVEAAG